MILIEYDNALSATNAKDFLNNRHFLDTILKVFILFLFLI